MQDLLGPPYNLAGCSKGTKGESSYTTRCNIVRSRSDRNITRTSDPDLFGKQVQEVREVHSFILIEQQIYTFYSSKLYQVFIPLHTTHILMNSFRVLSARPSCNQRLDPASFAFGGWLNFTSVVLCLLSSILLSILAAA